MSVYSVNQNRQFYVVDKVVTAEPAKLGELKVGMTADKKQLFFKHFGQGGLTRTDIINVDSIEYARITDRSELRTKLKKATVSLDPNVNGGQPIAGQDYVLRVVIHNYLAPGDTNWTVKYGAVHAYAGLTPDEFYKKLAKSLEMNFSREITPLLTFKATATGVEIEEVEQPWNLGHMAQEPVNFELISVPVRYQGDDVAWAVRDEDGYITIEDSGKELNDGKKIADLEWFCMGERGDQYRDNVPGTLRIPSKAMVNPDEEYDVFDMHYAFIGDGVSNQKSEKDVTLVATDPSVLTQIETALTGLGITVQKKA